MKDDQPKKYSTFNYQSLAGKLFVYNTGAFVYVFVILHQDQDIIQEWIVQQQILFKSNLYKNVYK